jgi:hypothetical protein
MARGERLGQIDSPGRNKLVAGIDEFYLPRVQLGQTATVDWNGKSYRMKVAKIYPTVRNGQFEIDLQFLDGEPPQIQRGQTLQAKLTLGDPVRANTSGMDLTVSGSGDADLDGNEFVGISADLVEVSPVRYGTGGSETVEIKLSGIPGLDNDLLSTIADPTNWRLRTARLWRIIRDANNVQQGGFHSFYTGRIVQIVHSSQNGGQVLT